MTIEHVLWGAVVILISTIGFLVRWGSKTTLDSIKNEIADDRKRNTDMHKEICTALKELRTEMKEVLRPLITEDRCKQLMVSGACQVGQLEVLKELKQSMTANNTSISGIREALADHQVMYQKKMDNTAILVGVLQKLNEKLP